MDPTPNHVPRRTGFLQLAAFVLLAAAVLRRPGARAALIAAGLTAAVSYALFDLLAPQSWPQPWLSALWPG